MSRMQPEDVAKLPVLGVPIDAVTWDLALERVSKWASNRDSRVVCFCNAHSVVTAKQDSKFHAVILHSDLAVPDGTPVAWMMRRLGAPAQQRISGPDFMMRYCTLAARRRLPVGLFGSTPATLAQLKERLSAVLPDLEIVVAISPPFRPLSATEDQAIVDEINASGATALFVGLGCPKQETWMRDHRGRVHAVMLGVGAAFDFHAGTIRRAPEWMRRNGMEWLHRLFSEPGRLWRRYLVTNTSFVVGALRQLWLGGGRAK